MTDRHLYHKKGFASIYEFAAKLAGLSRDHVDTVLRLERKFEDKPELHRALVDGQISPNKLIRIASVATTENQQEMFETARDLSRRALDVFVKDYRQADGSKNGQPDGLFEPQNGVISLAGQTFEGQSGLSVKQNGTVAEQNHDFEILVKLSPEVKMKIKEMMDKGLDINRELLDFFEERELKIVQEKNEAASQMEANKTEKWRQGNCHRDTSPQKSKKS